MLILLLECCVRLAPFRSSQSRSWRWRNSRAINYFEKRIPRGKISATESLISDPIIWVDLISSSSNLVEVNKPDLSIVNDDKSTWPQNKYWTEALEFCSWVGITASDMWSKVTKALRKIGGRKWIYNKKDLRAPFSGDCPGQDANSVVFSASVFPK